MINGMTGSHWVADCKTSIRQKSLPNSSFSQANSSEYLQMQLRDDIIILSSEAEILLLIAPLSFTSDLANDKQQNAKTPSLVHVLILLTWKRLHRAAVVNVGFVEHRRCKRFSLFCTFPLFAYLFFSCSELSPRQFCSSRTRPSWPLCIIVRE